MYQSAKGDVSVAVNKWTTMLITALSGAKQLNDYIQNYGGKELVFVKNEDGTDFNWSGVTGDEVMAALDAFNQIDQFCTANNLYKSLKPIIGPII
jgi:hypothetical protein